VGRLADSVPARWRAQVLLAAWCGLRRGELLALRRRDIDLMRGTVRIEQAKTDAARRTVAIPPHILADLSAHLEQWVDPGRDALVFTGVKGGTLRTAAWQTAWNDARRAVGRPELHLHDLRHTGNTLAAATGASTKELMARMGHASPSQL
jgi:integrase